MKCAHCGKVCKRVVKIGGKHFCCDQCYSKHKKKEEPKICKFC